MSEGDYKIIILGEINKIRQSKGLKPLKIHKRLSFEAQKISVQMMAQKGEKTITLPPQSRYGILSYATENLLQFPSNILEIITTIGFYRIGIGVVFQRNDRFPQGNFFVSIIYRE